MNETLVRLTNNLMGLEPKRKPPRWRFWLKLIPKKIEKEIIYDEESYEKDG